MKGKQFLTWLLSSLLIAAPAFATEWRPGDHPVNPPHGPITTIWDGTTIRNWMGDPNGIGRVTEEYPEPYQTERTVLSVAIPVTTGFKQLGNSWTAFPFQFRCFEITTAVAAGNSRIDNCHLYLFGSDDNVTFRPVFASSAVYTGAYVVTDTTKTDTLMVTLGALNRNGRFVLDPTIFGGRYLAWFGARDSTAGSGSAYNISIAAEGRMH